MTRLTLLRHGETKWNRAGVMQGQADIALSEVGRVQARRAAAALAQCPFDAVWSSQLQRARETAAIVGAPHGLSVVEDARLAEINVGSWSGCTRAEVLAEMPDERERFLAGDDYRRSATGERASQVAARGRAAVEAICEAHPGGWVLVVTHGFFIRALVSDLLGLAGFGCTLGTVGNLECAILDDRVGIWQLRGFGIPCG